MGSHVNPETIPLTVSSEYVVNICIGQYHAGDGRLPGATAWMQLGSGFDLGTKIGGGAQQEPRVPIFTYSNLGLAAGFTLEISCAQGRAVAAGAVPLWKSATRRRAQNLDGLGKPFSSPRIYEGKEQSKSVFWYAQIPTSATPAS